MNTEKIINSILARRGYLLKYQETFPSSAEDMYELKVWIEDNSGKQYDYHTIYVHDKVDPKKKAFTKLVDLIIESYYNNLTSNETNRE